ncbi:3',5'-cyclic AMP phosphodiesterase CpdA [Devosia lucknowensis]|uniref:3',5'-cyclic AMP phosphodiesterase CpdA n=1 Tax=Devosia lucknowensis TaxID=1096929 RepID=A0A1Y6E7B3_9HYPH|nr:metallophosphoesterase [Devosia lucknowensis]SMQ58578.1 3',5'-cyclic AMP phosphodiesterase CpdA [Devosia lucknowensis]
MKILHISDLHFGHHDPALAAGFADDINAQRPDLIVASGDFTQIGTKEEFEQAREFLDKLHAPIFAVPGNHDVPAVNILRRFLNPYGLYKKYIARDLEPYLEMNGVVLVGMRTSRRARLEWNWGHGTISRSQLEDLEERFNRASPDAVRVIVAHHPLLFPTEPMMQKTKRVKRADEALECFASLGVRLVLSGHFHLSYVRKHEARDAAREGQPMGLSKAVSAPILVAQASSAISTRLRGEANAYNLIDIGDQISVTVREWRDGQWRTRDKATEPV